MNSVELCYSLIRSLGDGRTGGKSEPFRRYIYKIIYVVDENWYVYGMIKCNPCLLSDHFRVRECERRSAIEYARVKAKYNILSCYLWHVCHNGSISNEQ